MKRPFRAIAASEVPWLTIDQMVEADRLAIEEFGIELLQMMEHAGSALAELTQAVAQDGTGQVTVLAGGGNNGGGGLCAARHLANRGFAVEVVLASERLGPAPAHHLATLRAMGIEPVGRPRDGGRDGSVVVDAMVGYGLDGPLRGKSADLADWSRGRTVVSLDFPSGWGHGGVDPAATLTLALPKEGLRGLAPLYLADLGLPAALWARMGLAVGPVFRQGRIVELAG